MTVTGPTENVIPLISWHAQLTPGKPFRVPAQWVIPHGGDFWGAPKHVVESIDTHYGDWACLATYDLTPASEHMAGCWVYQATTGQTHVWHDDDTGETIHHRYLGIYRVWGLTQDWTTGTLGFKPGTGMEIK
jgi:hypothetical protein